MNHSRNSQDRYVRIPTPLKRASGQNKKAFKFTTLIELHKQSIEREKKILDIDNYGLLWISFFRGIIVTIIFDKVIFG